MSQQGKKQFVCEPDPLRESVDQRLRALDAAIERGVSEALGLCRAWGGIQFFAPQIMPKGRALFGCVDLADPRPENFVWVDVGEG